MFEITIFVRERDERHGLFEARLADGELLVESSMQPFFDAARVLVARGLDPEAILQMVRENGTRSLRGPVGEAAKLTVEATPFGKPVFRRYRKGDRPAGKTPPVEESGLLDPSPTSPQALRLAGFSGLTGPQGMAGPSGGPTGPGPKCTPLVRPDRQGKRLIRAGALASWFKVVLEPAIVEL